ncbi:MAG: flagellar brake protein [Mobilitalea sp.]
MIREILTLGDKIDIKPLDRNGRPVHNARTFASQLLDLVDFDVIHIAAPIVYSKTIVLDVGEYYNLCFYSSKGLYQCNCIVLSNHKENNAIVAVVRITTNLEKFQRRQYYRLECIHEVEYRVINMEEEILEKKSTLEDFRNPEERAECRMKLSQFDKVWFPAAITDLSGGGARFNSETNHNKGEKVRIRLEFISGGELKKMILGAEIISSNRIMNRMGSFEHRVEYNNILQKDREVLIKYIFEQDRRRRRNEIK